MTDPDLEAVRAYGVTADAAGEALRHALQPDAAGEILARLDGTRPDPSIGPDAMRWTPTQETQ
ncbi:hypothetical protein J4H86_21230 [Spiractinospora alimapuensis]|uniref:hypothetical protein n=1 Tax=Spiractinospora alimapuensis TaxID=2820884 RepID=UPI001F45E379|nr:hypothetical protein [Spiractinospora alimapuensis]QVQ51314.1 hypothetical protein J4H86_21230 [Spiractinospora alimapuensis]